MSSALYVGGAPPPRQRNDFRSLTTQRCATHKPSPAAFLHEGPAGAPARATFREQRRGRMSAVLQGAQGAQGAQRAAWPIRSEDHTCSSSHSRFTRIASSSCALRLACEGPTARQLRARLQVSRTQGNTCGGRPLLASAASFTLMVRRIIA